MNIYQRIVLIVGAIAIIIALATTPNVANYEGFILRYDVFKETYPNLFWHTDYKLALLRAVGVIGVTALLFFAFKGIKK